MKKEDKLELWFISIYFVEQFTLILLYVIRPDLIHVWISSFPVIFLSTIACEKVLIRADFKKKLEAFIEQTEQEKKSSKKFKEIKKLYLK